MAGHGQPRKGADKRTKAVNSYFSPAELERLDRAQAVEMPDKPRGAYVRYAALQHVEGVDTSILELRAERWYYYHKDKYGREECYTLDGLQAKEQLDEIMTFEPSNYQITPAMYKSDDIDVQAAERLEMHALAALLRAEAAEQ